MRIKDSNDVLQAVKQMPNETKAKAIAGEYGLKIENISWEDCARSKQSCWGPCISDMTLQVANTPLPVIRLPNYTDVTWDQSLKKIPLRVGNEKGEPLTTVSLYDYLNDITKYLHEGSTWKSSKRSLLSDEDSVAIMTSQACFLPVPEGDVTEFNVCLRNYQSKANSPAVLVIVASKAGSSAQIVDESSAKKLYFNQNGEKASFEAKRLKDQRREQGKPVEGPMTPEERAENMILIVQVPLKQTAAKPSLKIEPKQSLYTGNGGYPYGPPDYPYAPFGGPGGLSPFGGPFGGPGGPGGPSPYGGPYGGPFGGPGGPSPFGGPFGGAQPYGGSPYGGAPSPGSPFGAPPSGKPIQPMYYTSHNMASVQKGYPQSMACAPQMGYAPQGLTQKRKNKVKEEKCDVDQAMVHVGKTSGKYEEIKGIAIERDTAFPIRVTLQFYKATSNATISHEIVEEIATQMVTARSFANGKDIGSLVTETSERKTESQPEKEIFPWWSSFWKEYHPNFPDLSQNAAKQKLLAQQNAFATATPSEAKKLALSLLSNPEEAAAAPWDPLYL